MGCFFIIYKYSGTTIGSFWLTSLPSPKQRRQTVGLITASSDIRGEAILHDFTRFNQDYPDLQKDCNPTHEIRWRMARKPLAYREFNEYSYMCNLPLSDMCLCCFTFLFTLIGFTHSVIVCSIQLLSTVNMNTGVVMLDI